MTTEFTVAKRRNVSASRWRRLPIWAAPALVLAACSGSGPQTSLDPAGPIAEKIDGLWLLVFWIAVVVFVLVEAALVYSIVRFRERPNSDRRPKQLHGNTRLEIIWTIIPTLLLAGLTVPTLQTLFEIRAVPEGPEVVTIQVVGHQWWWEFQYPEGFTTANELHIPADTPVNLEMTSVDVIHSFWVPKLNGKRDVVPGRMTNLTLEAYEPTPPGEPHPGQCAEFCGLAHADMRFKVFVDSAEDYEAWVAQQMTPATVPTEGIAAQGYDTFTAVCVACHNATVIGEDGNPEVLGPVGYVNGVFADLAPDLTHFGERITFGAGTFDTPWAEGATEDHLRQWLADPSSIKPMSPERNVIPPIGCVPEQERVDLALEAAIERAVDEEGKILSEETLQTVEALYEDALAFEALGDQEACVRALEEARQLLGYIPDRTLILGMPNFGLDQNDITALIALLEGWE